MTQPDTEVVQITTAQASLADRRCLVFLRACLSEQNFLKALIRACYFQGLEDGYEAATRPKP